MYGSLKKTFITRYFGAHRLYKQLIWWRIDRSGVIEFVGKSLLRTWLENIDNMCIFLFFWEVSWFILKCNQSTELVRKDSTWIIGWTAIFLRRTSVLFEDSVHPGRLTWNLQITHLEGKWSSKPSWLCSMLIFRGVIIKTRSIHFDRGAFTKKPSMSEACLPIIAYALESTLDGYFDGGMGCVSVGGGRNPVITHQLRER